MVLVNRYGRAWLALGGAYAAAAAWGLVPWRLLLGFGIPWAFRPTRRLVVGDAPRSLSDRQLTHQWQVSSLAIVARMPASSRVALVARRQGLLDEIVRRGTAVDLPVAEPGTGSRPRSGYAGP